MAVIKINYFFVPYQSDWTWYAVLLLVWNECEINSIIIAACIPTLMPMFRAILGRQPLRRHSTYPSWNPTQPTAISVPAYARLRGPRDTWTQMSDLDAEGNILTREEHTGQMGDEASQPELVRPSWRTEQQVKRVW